MRKLLLASAIALIFGTSAHGQGVSIVKSGPYTPLGHCQITSLASAVALVTASCASGAVPAGATIAEICVETAGVRYLDDGTSPTTSLGIPVVPSSLTLPACYAYSIIPLTQVQFIAISGSPVIDVSFYKY